MGDDAMRPVDRWLVVFGALVIGMSLGIVLIGPGIVGSHLPVVDASTPLSTHAPRGGAGGTYTLASDDMLWVERLGMEAWHRADTDHDTKGQDRIGGVFEHFFPKAGTRVRVIVHDGTVRQLEILDGPYAGRRGWTDTYSDQQYVP